MVDREVFDRRLAKLEELLRALRGMQPIPQTTFLRAPALRAQAERWLHLSAECCIDIAHHLVADQGWRTPTSYREVFEILELEGVLTSDLATRMARWAGLRNVLVHLYLDLDHVMVHRTIAEDLDDLEEYARAVSRFVDDRTGDA